MIKLQESSIIFIAFNCNADTLQTVVVVTVVAAAAAVASITVTVVIFCVVRTYYLSTDSGYSKFVIHNLRYLHCHTISNCLLTNTVSFIHSLYNIYTLF